MAGHSQFKNIMYRKGAQDAKRAKVFTKIIRELTVSAKAGADPESNPRLRQAIVAARTENMPKDTMERAIKRGAGGEDNSDYVEMRYEGYGPSGVAIIVEALTDNRNRTAADVRSTFTKFGGNLGETNSVSFMFDRVGLMRYPDSTADHDAIFEAALEAGALNVESEDGFHEIESSMEEFATVRDHLISKFGDPESASLVWKPQNLMSRQFRNVRFELNYYPQVHSPLSRSQAQERLGAVDPVGNKKSGFILGKISWSKT